MKYHILRLIMLPFFLVGCAESVSRDDNPRILAMGDSLLAAHRISNKSITNSVEAKLDKPVIDRSVMGARILYRLPISGSMGMSIPKQYKAGNWDWVILNGGGNDLWLGCGCILCDRKINRLISDGGQTGAIPKLISKIRGTGARVIYVGYLRSPGVGSIIDHCRNEGDELERRIDTFAQKDDGVYFLSLMDLVPFGDRTYHGVDMIHPSIKASWIIGERVAEIIQP
ncbi:MAG: SGNH/GDSL hydrolase family protein [Amylibacter sp.]